MADSARVAPYNRLKESFREFARQAVHPSKAHSMTIKPAESGLLRDIHQRAIAAQQCGREVTLVADEDGTLKLYLVEKRPAWPWEL